MGTTPLLALLLAIPLVRAWPDGAPCLTTTFDSMNPLEAIEHQGGLQLSEPPYEIEVDQRCYWRGQPIAFTLRGKNESVWFKGFAIQPFEYNQGTHGRRIGRLLRLDDNGSWQYQCFRFKDAVTHSHNQRKKQMKIWWRNDDDESRFVQFVATVVHSQKRFWVKSVLSAPIPPCRIQRDFGPYTPPMPSVPPPVKDFKMDTDREFGNFFIDEALPNSITGEGGFGGSSTPFANPLRAPRPRKPSRKLIIDKMSTIIPVPSLTIQHRKKDPSTASPVSPVRSAVSVPRLSSVLATVTMFWTAVFTAAPTTQSFAFNFQRQQEQERQRQLEEQRSMQRQREMERERQERERERQRAEQQRLRQQQAEQNRIAQQRARDESRRRNFGTFRPTRPTTSIATTQRPVVNNGVCSDIDPPSRCIPWAQYCQASSYMHQYCKRTCHFC